MSDEHERAAERHSVPQPGETAGSTPNGGSVHRSKSPLITGFRGLTPEEAYQPGVHRSKSPLITAVEIENFKGISRPVRIEMRPITLLFGRNSAGKSTVLHALCYAHEILSGGNVDAGKTHLGGNQIDLGGFRNLVHAHDLERDLRLRFELSFENWQVPGPLVERMVHHDQVEPELADEFAAWVDSQARAESVRSGWVELAIAWNKLPEGPVLVGYEVGVNEILFGRIARAGSFEDRINLEFNWAHPLFDPLRPAPLKAANASTPHVNEASDPKTNEWQLHRVTAYAPTTLPDWDRPLTLNRKDLEDDETSPLYGAGSSSVPDFETLVSGFVVGIGRTLRDELGALRYVGPVRKLRPRTTAEPGLYDHGTWSDGSAAWNLLLHHDPDPRTRRGLIDDVNDWLERNDRLDTGYKLYRKSIVELPATAPGVTEIHFLNQLPVEYRNENGDVDPDYWAKTNALEMAGRFGCDPDDVEARIKERSGGEREPIDMDSSGKDDLGTEEVVESNRAKVVESNRTIYRLLTAILEVVDGLEKGGAAVKDLVHAIAAAPHRTRLQLVTAESGLLVRTSDIGVGISQILPVVVAALDPQRPGITAIEQPELHLHPKLQVELGDLFAQPVDDGRVFLLENHSEHLMLRLLRRIEETHSGELPEGKPALRPDQVSVVFLEQVDGAVRATPLRIDETGEFIDRWPHGFFDERDDELF